MARNRVSALGLPAYYQVKNGRGYWYPSAALRALGFSSVVCGMDGAEARNTADQWNARAMDARSKTPSGVIESAGTGRAGYVYFLRSGGRVKIGFSTNPFNRVAGLRTGMSNEVDVFVAKQGTRRDELNLHDEFAPYRVGKSEWFVASGPVLKAMMRAISFRDIDIGAHTPAIEAAAF